MVVQPPETWPQVTQTRQAAGFLVKLARSGHQPRGAQRADHHGAASRSKGNRRRMAPLPGLA